MLIRQRTLKQTELSAQPDSPYVLIATTTVSSLTIFTDEPASEDTHDSENDSATELVSSIEEESSVSDVVTTESSDESEEEAGIHYEYSDTMTAGELAAVEEKLDGFLAVNHVAEKPSFVTMSKAFDAGARLNDFFEKAEAGAAKLDVTDGMSSHQRMAAEMFNHADAPAKVQFLNDMFKGKVDHVRMLMLMIYPEEMRDLMAIRGDIGSKLLEVGDLIEAKNKERYEVIAKMNAYPSVLKARRAEIDAMLDAGNEREYRATLNL